MTRRNSAARRKRATPGAAFSTLAVNARDALRAAAAGGGEGAAQERAAQTALVALEADASDALARVVLARVHLRRGEPAAALEWLAPLANAGPVPDFSPAALTAWARVLGGDEAVCDCAAELAGAPASARVVTDKVPGNFYLLAAVATGLTGARVIHVRRDPLDVCTSIFRPRFASGHAWSYRFADIGAYHAHYERLIEHWAHTLRLPVLDVHYEALVSDFEATARTLIDFVGLGVEAACLAPHRSARAQTQAIGSASHWQARQPPTSTSLGRFDRYANAFAPLVEALDG